MGQLQAREVEGPAELYEACSTEELHRLVEQRGLSSTISPRAKAVDRILLAAMLRAYDAGVKSTSQDEASTDATSLDTATIESVSSCSSQGLTISCCPPDVKVVQRILDAPVLKGVDIGGTLVKMVLALPHEEEDMYRFQETFGATGHTRYDLEMAVELGGRPYLLRFVSGATNQIADAIQSVKRCRGCSCAGSAAPSKDLMWLVHRSSCGAGCEEMFQSEGQDLVPEDQRSLTCESSSSSDSPPSPLLRRIFTAGGGAHKFAPVFLDALGVELVPVKELSAVVDGLLFLASHRSASPDGLLFEVPEDGPPVAVPWPEVVFPFLVVNIGSGVSILRVNSAAEGDYIRVGGTACGGGTFLGLARALTSAETFQEALDLAERGNASRCDLLVRDIYGEEGSVNLGLKGSLTASNCGRICCEDRGGKSYSEEDLARALLQMVTQQCVLLSGAYAKHEGCVDRVFFVGGFIEDRNHLARAAIANNFRSLGGRAYFLKHCDFLGALGSLRSCVEGTSISTEAHPVA